MTYFFPAQLCHDMHNPVFHFLEKAKLNSLSFHMVHTQRTTQFFTDVEMNVPSKHAPCTLYQMFIVKTLFQQSLILIFISRQSQIQTTYNHLFSHFEHSSITFSSKFFLSINLHVFDLFIRSST